VALQITGDFFVDDRDLAAIQLTIRQTESGGNYQERSNGIAFGAYQFVDTTWKKYGGFTHASDAPPAVQDARAAIDIRAALSAHGGSAASVFIQWYWPRTFNEPAWLDKIPRPDLGNKKTVREYAELQLQRLQANLGRTPSNAVTLTPTDNAGALLIGGTIKPAPQLEVDIIDDLELRGSKLTARVAEAAIGLSLDFSADEVSQVEITFLDPGFKIWAMGILSKGNTGTWRGWPMVITAYKINSGAEQITVTMRSKVANELRKERVPDIWSGQSGAEWLADRVAKAGGVALCEQDATRPTITKSQTDTRPESDWDVGKRISAEVGMLFFEVAGIVIRAHASWIVERFPPVATWTWGKDDFLVDAQVSADEDNDLAKIDPVEITVTVLASIAAQCRPGHPIRWAGLPGTEGVYLTTSVHVEAGEPTGEVVLRTPVDPDVSSSPDSKSGQVQTIVQWMSAQMQHGVYELNAPRDLSNPDPHVFDCSSLVWNAVRRNGGPTDFPGSAQQQLDYCRRKGTIISVDAAIHIYGALLFNDRPQPPDHVAVSLGDGRTIEAANPNVDIIIGKATASRFNAAALIPGVDYGGIH